MHEFDGFRFEPIHDDEGKQCEHEFARACHPAPAAGLILLDPTRTLDNQRLVRRRGIVTGRG